jgi:hypothetical protein
MLTLPRAIHLLIEERAKVVAHARVVAALNLATYPSDADRDQARREIEREHLTEKSKS